MSAAAFITDLVLAVIARARKKPNDITAESIAAAIKDKVEEAVIATIAVELKKFEAALGMVLATDELADAAAEVVSAMREAERNPKMGLSQLPIEEMPPDWHPPKEPDGSSNR